MRRLDDLAVRILPARGAWDVLRIEHEHVADAQQQRLLDGGQFAGQVGQLLARFLAPKPQPGAGRDVGAFPGLEDQAAVVLLDDVQHALLAARVPEAELVADLGVVDALGGHRDDSGLGAALHGVVGDEADTSRRDDAPHGVAFRTNMNDARPGFEFARAQLGPCQIHDYPAFYARIGRGGVNVRHHALPGSGIIMGTVDTSDVHAGRNHFLCERGIVGGLSG